MAIFGNGVQNSKEQISEILYGIINHKRTPTPRHPLHKIATEIEENIVKEAKLYFLKLALGEANFVDHRPRAYVYKNWTEKRSDALNDVTLKTSAYSSPLGGAENLNKR